MKTSCFLTLLFFCISGQSQKLVNSTGNTIVSNSYQIEYSVGEIAITTLAGNSNYSTQGLLQPLMKYINPDCNIVNEPLQNFPNPTRDKLRLVGQFDWITGYHIYAVDGKLLRIASFYNNYIDISNLPAATYLIKLYPACDNKFKVLKVVKQ